MTNHARRRAGRLALLLGAALVGAASGAWAAPHPADPLQDGFRSPPNSARPRVWWHWMNGNITKDGIRKDLEWMHRTGLGGVQNFDASLSTPQIVPKRLVYMTPDWKDAFRYAVGLADSLGLEFGTAASPGWSETGGPWVQPKDGMKKLAWSEAEVSGAGRFDGQLPPLPDATGPFQELPMVDALAGLGGGPPTTPPTFHADTVVLAFPQAPASSLPQARILSVLSGKPLTVAAPGHAGEGLSVETERGTPDRPGGVVLEYDTPQTVRAASLFLEGAIGMFAGPSLRPTLEAQAADGGWRRVADFAVTEVPTTVSFAPVSASRFRILVNPIAAPGGPASGPPPQGAVKIGHLRLVAEPAVNDFEAKAGFAVAGDYYALDKDTGPDVAGIAPGSVIDLTDKLTADGHLDWTPPPGDWKILRLGYSLTGTTNHPATAEATGLEVDKYDGRAVHDYLETYIGMLSGATGPDLIGRRGLSVLVTDSIEVGASNWTRQILDDFKRLRGYDARPWLPALTGVIVGSRSQSDSFLYDFRRTLADLIASKHYGQVAQTAHAHGLTVYGEALESGRPSLGDDMTMRSHADIPMSAMWTFSRDQGPNPTYVADIKGAASVAHIYGQNLVAAESMTALNAPWAFAPSDLKPVIDLELVTGVNRPVIHTSVHQPVDDKVPGLSLLIFGQYFNRHETWAEMARPWIDYIARSAFMLQQGRNVADVGYFYGEEAPLTGLYDQGMPADAPVRYAYDFVSADALLTQLKPVGSELVAPGGARYRALYIGGSGRRMTLAVLGRLAALADGGATIIGEAPEGSPGLKDDAGEYSRLVRRLWSGQPVTPVGRGRVIASRDVEASLQRTGLGPDFSYGGGEAGAKVLFLHRRLRDGDIYFVDNRQTRTERIEASFRVTGKTPEIWRADTGAAEAVSYRIVGDHTVVPLDLGPDDAVFVVFRKPAARAAATAPTHRFTRFPRIGGRWEVTFQHDRGAPARIDMETLAPLSQNADPGVKYFSGTATYRTSFSPPRMLSAGKQLMLDLGAVGDVAEVRVNGKLMGTAWKAPYRVDIGPAVHPGRNELEIRVADLWVNRLIGDAQPGVIHKITFTSLPTYGPDAPLRPSGLIGPVSLLAEAPAGR